MTRPRARILARDVRTPRLQTNPQRARIVAAMAQLVSERGEDAVTVARVLEVASVSRSTFYEHFADSGDCLSAVFEELVARAGRRARAAVGGRAGWVAQMRAGLLAVLEVIDEEPELSRVCVARALSGGVGGLTRDGGLLGELTAVIDQGRSESPPGRLPPPGVAESVVGGMLSMIYARLLGAGERPLIELLNPLMGMVVLPYLGEAAALRELSRPNASASSSGRDPLEGLSMRVTYRTARVLSAIAAAPGLSNREIGQRAGVGDRGQMSRLLARLARLRLIETTARARGGGAANAWQLTATGEAVERAFRQRSPRQRPRRE